MLTSRSQSGAGIQSSSTRESDFPHTYREFVEKFYNNDACAAYLEELRWPTGFSCPICQAVSHRRRTEQAVVTGPITEADMTFGYDWGSHQTRRS